MLANALAPSFWLEVTLYQLNTQSNERPLTEQCESKNLTPPLWYDAIDLSGHKILAYADRFSGWL